LAAGFGAPHAHEVAVGAGAGFGFPHAH
jgi:hypothetical protein